MIAGSELVDEDVRLKFVHARAVAAPARPSASARAGRPRRHNVGQHVLDDAVATIDG